MSMFVDVIEGCKKRRCLRRFASVKFTVLLHVDEDGCHFCELVEVLRRTEEGRAEHQHGVADLVVEKPVSLDV